MAAADDQTDARKYVAAGGETASIEVAVDVIDAEQGYIESDGQHLGGADADQERADQTRRMMNGDARELIETNAGLLQGFVDDGEKALQMAREPRPPAQRRRSGRAGRSATRRRWPASSARR